jgi:pSer/pThr/pTyr-binding forkhead associated (FHA) protein
MNSNIKMKQFENLQKELPKFPQMWYQEDVIKWLELIGMIQYKEKFEEMRIDGLIIFDLDENDLKHELGITKKLHLKKIVKCLVILREYENYLINLEKQKIESIIFSEDKKKNEIEESLEEIKSIEELTARDEKNEVNKIKNDNNDNEVKVIIKSIDSSNEFEYQLKNTCTTVGRHSSNDIVIYDETISRFHAKIYKVRNKFYIKDQGSTVGTFLKIQEKIKLEKNLIFEIGSFQFKVNKIIINNSAHLDVKIKESYVEISLYQNLDDSILENPIEQEVYNYLLKSGDTIGRKNNNIVAFPSDLHMSNVHSKIEFSGHCFYIEDLISTNGTWLRISPEFQKSQKVLLNNEDVFKIGNNTLYQITQKIVTKNKEVSFEREDFEISEIEEADENINEIFNNLCRICKKTEKNCLIMPCKHNILCIDCSDQLEICPYCQNKILEIIKIFKS